jgi:hypothetical protein
MTPHQVILAGAGSPNTLSRTLLEQRLEKKDRIANYLN